MPPKPDPAGTILPPPYCSACGHDLTGATSSAACPECGRPLVEVMTRGPRAGTRANFRGARRYTSERRLFGMPLVAIAYGLDENGRMGHAKGYFAFGDVATGVFAFGGFARGLVAFGGMSLGGVTFGGLSIGTFSAFGGMSVAWLGSAVGGFAAGLMASGGGAIGAIAQGGLAIGWLARGAEARGVHAWSQRAAPSDETRALFDQLAWLVGGPGGGPQLLHGVVYTTVIAIAIMFLAALPAVFARPRRDRIAEELGRGGEGGRP